MAFATLGDREKVWELFNMINPLSHASEAAAIEVYKVEPYVMAADVYANESHKGRGGWTWYTGSAGWMYQFIIHSLLGMELENDQLRFRPCLPPAWPSVSVTYRFGKSTYRITILQSDNGCSPASKMRPMDTQGKAIKLIDDGMEHEVELSFL